MRPSNVLPRLATLLGSTLLSTVQLAERATDSWRELRAVVGKRPQTRDDVAALLVAGALLVARLERERERCLCRPISGGGSVRCLGCSEVARLIDDWKRAALRVKVASRFRAMGGGR